MVKKKKARLHPAEKKRVKKRVKKTVKKTVKRLQIKKLRLAWRRFHNRFKQDPRFRKTVIFLFSVFFLSSFSFYWIILKDMPSPKTLTQTQSPQTTIIRDRHGTVLYKVYKNANRIKLSWEEIPENVKKATLAIEDADFYSHHGISLKSILRAFLYNLRQEDIKLYQGGSTITQQLVKNRLVGSEKTYVRKIREVLASVWTEMYFKKQEILTMYLNEVGYGGPAYGIEAAAQMYFAKSAKSLSFAQAAFLAGLPAAPTTFSPFGNNPNLAFDRERQVLERMLKLEMITRQNYQDAINEKIVFAPQRIDILAPHFVMFVKNQLVQKFGEGKVTEGGMDVTTTLDLPIQQKAESIVAKQIAEIKDIYNIHNAGSLITDPKTGEILAMVGSANYFDIENKGYVNVTTALRQPGSSIKPVNYAYAFDHGFTPTSVIEDSPVTYVAPGSTESYTPQNYDGRFHGLVTLRNALANSYNVPAVKVLNSYGVQKMIEMGQKMGIRSWYPAPPIGLSLTLGGAEVTMLDMARAYGTIENLGVKKDLKIIKEIRDSNDNNITDLFYQMGKDISLVGEAQASENPPGGESGQQVVSPLSAYWLTDILSDNTARLAAFGPYAKLTIPNYKVAVKTGTSNNFRDNWTIGYTPDYLTVVWVGNNDGSFMNKNLVSGITGAAPIWNEIMTELLKNTAPKDFPVPQGLIPVKICAVNGLLTCPYCPQEKTEYFTADKVPTKKCFFKSPQECDEARKQAEGKSEEEKKQLLNSCPYVVTPPT
ncbi:transglycosylase domain-containing protein [Candidatus Gottesmanbacteria bacterium]|nr:transglycosylase domain-containing protein [Candidatus Gottesmanbacteria bacterium]